MATYTTNYQLHQWVPGDNFLRTDFNTDFQKIDAAIKGVETAAIAESGKKCELTIGQFTGTGSGAYTVDLGFRPRFLMIWGESYSGFWSEVMREDYLTITDSGFSMAYSERGLANYKGKPYYYHVFH